MTRRTLLQSISLPLFAASAPVNDGKFTLGLYQLPTRPNPWRLAHDAGFQVVHLSAKAEEFAKARDHGMKGWTSVGSISPKSRSADKSRIRKIVAEFKNNPALMFWETEDEPSYQYKKAGPRVAPSVIRETYRFLKTLDPERPVYLNHAPTNLVSTLRQYNPGGDIIATDIYPVVPHGIRPMYALWPDGRQGDFLNRYVSQIGDYTDKMRQVAGPSRAVFMVLQAFAWENLRGKDRDPKMVLYPTRTETRLMAYQAIVHGANGLLYWGISYTPPEAPLWDDIASVARELHELHSELSAPPVKLPLTLEYHDTGHSLDRGIEWIAKPSKGGIVLIAVNADCNPVNVTFGGLGKFGRCEVLFETGSIRLSNGAFRDSFVPFGVHVYRLV